MKNLALKTNSEIDPMSKTEFISKVSGSIGKEKNITITVNFITYFTLVS